MKLHTPGWVASWQFPMARISMQSRCPKIYAEIIDTATQHVVDALMKSLVSIQTKDLIAATNRIDIPFGMFTMSYDKFLERRKNDILHLSLMEYFPSWVLEKTKYCVVLDDLQQMIAKMMSAYQSGKMETIFEELAKAKKLFTIQLEVQNEYAENLDKLKTTTKELRLFEKKQRVLMTMLDISIQKKAIRSQVLKLVTGKIEQRYCGNYYNSGASQIILRTQLGMQRKEEEFDHYAWLVQREERVFECTHMKVAADSAMIKCKIKKWNESYEDDMERLLGDMAYKTNAIQVWKRYMEECKQKMKFFKEDKIRLIVWDANRKAEKLERERQEAIKLIKKQNKQRHNEKSKDKKKENKKEKLKNGKQKKRTSKGRHEKGKHKKED